MTIGLGDYDRWKLATPPEYDWPEHVCEDCGEEFLSPFYRSGCRCDLEPEPADAEGLNDMFDEANDKREAP